MMALWGGDEMSIRKVPGESKCQNINGCAFLFLFFVFRLLLYPLP